MVERKDVEAALEARRELGKEYEPELIEGFLAKIDKELAERKQPRPARQESRNQGAITPIILGTTAIGIPVTAIALSNSPGAGGIIVAIIAWIAICLSNITIAFFRLRD